MTNPRYGIELMSYDGLRGVLHDEPRMRKSKIPLLHDFRRTFCLAVLREGTDIFTLAKLMGHASTAFLHQYLKQTYQDTEQAHQRAGPVDNAGF